LLIVVEGDARPEIEGPVAALDFYEGPLFGLIRSLKSRGAWPADVDLYVLTSDHGLIPADQSTSPSRRPMTPARAAEAIYENYGRLAAVLATRRHAAAMLALPELYRRALFRKDTPFVQGVPVTYLDPGENDAADSIVAWLKNAQ
jgi:hypothetical protein